MAKRTKTNTEVMNLDEMMVRLHNTPVDSRMHKDILGDIQIELMRDSKYDEFAVAFHSNLSLKTTSSRVKKLREVTGIKHIENNEDFIFSDTMTFPEDLRSFEIKQRHQLEFNLKYKQLVVGAYITNGKYLVMLKNKEGRLKDKLSMIQGHVSYNENCLLLSQRKFLLDNMMREIREEIICDEVRWEEIKNHIKPRFFLSTKSEMISLEHFGIIYQIRLDYPDEIFKDLFMSGEPDKHDIEIVDLSQLFWSNSVESKLKMFDGWSSEIVRYLISSNI